MNRQADGGFVVRATAAGNDIGALEPAAEIDVVAAPGAEGAMLPDFRLAAGRAAAAFRR